MSDQTVWAIPASMLYISRDSDAPAIRLVIRGLDSLKAGYLEEAERRAQEAREVARRGRHPVGEGMAALVLSNIYWGTGRIHLAFERARQSRQIFKQQPAPDQRHNEAVAALNLGLVYHLMGNYSGALNEYYAARQMLDIACHHWTAQKEMEQAERCVQLTQWVEHLIEQRIESAPLERPLTLFFPVGFVDGVRATLRGEYSRDTSLFLDGKTLPIVPLRDWLILTADCCVFPVSRQVQQTILAQIGRSGNYILAQPGDPLPGDPFYISLDSQGTLSFRRLPDGTMIVEVVQSARVLGGMKPKNYRPIGLVL